MKFSGSIWRILFIILIGSFAIFTMVFDSDHPMPFEDVRQKYLIVLRIVSAGLLARCLYKDIKLYLNTKKLRSLLSTFIYILFFIAWILTPYILEERDKSPVLLMVGYNPNRGSVDRYSIELRENKTYKLTINNFWSHDTYRGDYKLTDSIIEFDKSIIDSVIVSPRLVIQNTKDSLNEKHIYQIDENGHRLKSSVVFKYTVK